MLQDVGGRPLNSGVRPVTGFHSPNHIPRAQRVKLSLISLALLAYGTYGIVVNDLYVPGKRRRGIHLHDVPAWIMYGAILCACAVMLSIIMDHYDQRDNEINYRRFAKIGTWGGFAFFFISLIWGLVDMLNRSHAA